MPTLITDPDMEGRLHAERAASGANRYDEVWEGTYMVAPLPNDEHQQLVMRLASIFQSIIDWPGLGNVRPGVNVSDRKADWLRNYRVPDVAVFLKDGQAKNCGEYWYGGPDFVVEVVSPGDQTLAKLPFYARVGVRELLVVDRDPWKLELYRLTAGTLELVDTSALPEARPTSSLVLPFTFCLVPGDLRPRIQVLHTRGERDQQRNDEWLV